MGTVRREVEKSVSQFSPQIPLSIRRTIWAKKFSSNATGQFGLNFGQNYATLCLR